MIPQDTIEHVREATDIAQVIGEYVRLKKRGRNYVGLCPFHTEKTPSFTVSPDKQIFYCFGCGKGGNVFNFLMEHERMSFVEVVRLLAERVGIRIIEDRGSEQRREARERLSYANQVALEYFRKLLFSDRYVNVLDGYLRNRRSLREETIEQFQLGLTGERWQGLIAHAASKDLSPEELVQAGLAVKSEAKKDYFDRFRQRLMFPIFNLSDKPIAFGGRTLKKGETAKYVNSPETPLYVKGNVLYGLNMTREHIRNAGFAYVVEGYFDLISLWQVGVRNVVASSGTAFTPTQARLLARFADDIYLFFDADSAGRTAALRSVDVLYDSGLEVRIIDSPSGEDPDSIAREQGSDRIEELRQTGTNYIPFRLRDISVSSAGIIGREKLVKEFRALGAKIADPTRRALFFAEAADALEVSPDLLRAEYAPPATDNAARAPVEKRFNPDEVTFLSLLFHQKGSIGSIVETVAPDDFDSRQLSRLYAAMITQYRRVGKVDARSLVDVFEDDDLISLTTEIAAKDWPEDQIASQTRRATEAIVSQKRKRLRARLREELAKAEAQGDQEAANRVVEEMKKLGIYAD